MPFSVSTLRSWEFISFVLVSLGAWLAQINGTLSGHQAIVIAVAAAGITALGRGLAKQNGDIKNWWQTTEFWVTVIGAAQAAVAQLNGTISGTTMTQIMSALAFALVLARGIAKVPPTPVLPVDPGVLPPDNPDVTDPGGIPDVPADPVPAAPDPVQPVDPAAGADPPTDPPLTSPKK